MALQDLTPQLRTRLSRMERAVGWFVILAIGLLMFGFGYYIYSTAERKGWFKTKATYFTFTDRATGLRVGDPVQLMGFPVGQITRIDAMAPEDPYNVYVEFEIVSPYYGYLWTEGSRAKVATADFLGKRSLEVTKGTGGYPTYVFHPLRVVTPAQAQQLPGRERWLMGEVILDPGSTNLLAWPMQTLDPELLAKIQRSGQGSFTVLDGREKRKTMTGVWHDREGRYADYTPQTKPYWLLSDESPALTERLEKIVTDIEKAVPNVLALTNQLSMVLSNASSLTSNLNLVALNAQPAVSQLAAATANLDRPGGLGEWLLPTNINARLDAALGSADATLSSANTTLTTANTNLASLVENLNRSLDNLASMTSNLNQQVHQNTNILSAISKTIVDADNFVQGLKRHWLLRSAFKERDPAKRPKSGSGSPGSEPSDKLRSPKERAR